MKATAMIVLVVHLATSLPASAAPAVLQQSHANARPFKLEATLVSTDIGGRRVTYRDQSTGALQTSDLIGESIRQVVKLKPGQRVILTCRAASGTLDPVVESVKKEALSLGSCSSLGFGPCGDHRVHCDSGAPP